MSAPATTVAPQGRPMHAPCDLRAGDVVIHRDDRAIGLVEHVRHQDFAPCLVDVIWNDDPEDRELYPADRLEKGYRAVESDDGPYVMAPNGQLLGPLPSLRAALDRATSLTLDLAAICRGPEATR